jgi:hypothetical protein
VRRRRRQRVALQILTAANDSAGAAVALLRMGTLFRKLGEVSAPPAPEAGPDHAFPAALGLTVLLMFPRRVRGFSAAVPEAGPRFLSAAASLTGLPAAAAISSACGRHS